MNSGKKSPQYQAITDRRKAKIFITADKKLYSKILFPALILNDKKYHNVDNRVYPTMYPNSSKLTLEGLKKGI